MKRIFTLTLFLIFVLCGKAQEENKSRIAIFDCLTENTSIDTDTKVTIREIITATLLNTGKYNIVQRTLLEKVMKEQNLQLSETLDDSQLSGIGKIINANKIVLPIITSPQDNMFMLSIKMLDVKTGHVDKQKNKNNCNFNDLFNEAKLLTLALVSESTDITTSQGGGETLSNPSNLTIQVRGVTFEMIYIKGGTFTMGATSEQGSDSYDDEYPAHQVTLSDYYIGKYEVTQAIWQVVMGNNRSYFKNGGNYPVDGVSYYDVQEFLSKLNQMTGKNFYLPTEAQWEYAARGGTKSQHYKYSGSNIIDDVAWYEDNSDSHSYPVGTKHPNELGIYDMSGNVCEWCLDWYGKYSSSSQCNPEGSSNGSGRVERGGSWDDDARLCRVSDRSYSDSDDGDHSYGFRLVLVF